MEALGGCGASSQRQAVRSGAFPPPRGPVVARLRPQLLVVAEEIGLRLTPSRYAQLPPPVDPVDTVEVPTVGNG